MTRQPTPDDLYDWLDRHGLNTNSGGPALGISKGHLMKLLAGGSPITPTIALLMQALDQLNDSSGRS
jgi:hypothetical protein